MVDIHNDNRGLLGVIEFNKIPFVPQRFFWIASVPAGVGRAGHAHKRCTQLLVVLTGFVRISVTDRTLSTAHLTLQIGQQYLLNPMTWLELHEFSQDAVLAVFADEPYDRSEYVETPEDFEQLLKTT